MPPPDLTSITSAAPSELSTDSTVVFPGGASSERYAERRAPTRSATTTLQVGIRVLSVKYLCPYHVKRALQAGVPKEQKRAEEETMGKSIG